MAAWTIVVGAGSGSRFGGDVPKQYADLRGRRVLDWSLQAARASSDGVVLVVAAERVDDPEPLADVVVAGGATRSASVRAGLAVVPEVQDDANVDVIVVHDAARPLATAEVFRAVIDAVHQGADAALPGVPVADTIKRVVDETVVETVDRADLVAVQTPQAFSASALRRAHEGEPEATDDAALIEAMGGRVVVVPGDPTNRKLTVAADLLLAGASIDAMAARGATADGVHR
jgi:2-C-methyl-D-erythritol 4-phosphate cytidylyltransferase